MLLENRMPGLFLSLDNQKVSGSRRIGRACPRDTVNRSPERPAPNVRRVRRTALREAWGGSAGGGGGGRAAERFFVVESALSRFAVASGRRATLPTLRGG